MTARGAAEAQVRSELQRRGWTMAEIGRAMDTADRHLGFLNDSPEVADDYDPREVRVAVQTMLREVSA